MNTWKDSSHWSQSDSEEKRKTPNEWEYAAKGIRVTVHHYVGCGDTWFVSCHDVKLDRHDLNTEDPEIAKTRAIRCVRTRLNAMLQALPEE